MFLLDSIRRFFVGASPIEGRATRRLRHQRIRLEHLERRLAHEGERLDNLKRALFLRAKGESRTGRVTLARKIKELDARKRATDENQVLCRSQIRVLSRLMDLKERDELRRELHATLPFAWRLRRRLTGWARIAMAWTSSDWDAAIAMWGSHELAIDQSEEEEFDKDIVAIVAAMEDAQAAEEVRDSEGAAEALLRMQTILGEAGSGAQLA